VNNPILSEIIVQILGFFIVFLVLRHFAWGKLLGAVDARRKSIDDAFTDIERQKKALVDLEKDYRNRLEHIEQEARFKIKEAADLGLVLAKDIQDKARADAQKMVERAEAEIKQDLAKAKLTLRDQIVGLSSLMTEKIIRERLDAQSHQKLVDEFIKDIERV